MKEPKSEKGAFKPYIDKITSELNSEELKVGKEKLELLSGDNNKIDALSIYNRYRKEMWSKNIKPTVLSIQNGLKKIGYDPGVIDGTWGENTKDALSKFLKKNKINLDPKPTKEVNQVINSFLNTENKPPIADSLLPQSARYLSLHSDLSSSKTNISQLEVAVSSEIQDLSFIKLLLTKNTCLHDSEIGLFLLEEAIDNEQKNAIGVLSEFLINNLPFSMNPKPYIELLEKLAIDLNNTEAQAALFDISSKSELEKYSKKNANEWFEMAYKNGHKPTIADRSGTTLFLAMFWYDEKNNSEENDSYLTDGSEAAKILLENVDYADPLSLVTLGKAMLDGVFIDKSIDQGIKLLEKSAEKGNDEAMEALAKAYLYGNYIPENYELAIKYYSSYIKLKPEDKSALLNLGWLFNNADSTRKCNGWIDS